MELVEKARSPPGYLARRPDQADDFWRISRNRDSAIRRGPQYYGALEPVFPARRMTMMKEKFRSYYTPNDREFESLWRDALIVLDANVLLNLYTYSTDTRDEILHLFESMKDSIWLPFHAGEEFHRNRCGVIKKEARKYNEMKKSLNDVVGKLSTQKAHPFINEELLVEFKDISNRINESLDAGKAEHEGLIRSDEICGRITNLFVGRVGDGFNAEERDEICTDGRSRYEAKTPPGFCDADKPEPDRYGDLLIWKELIRHAKTENRDVIFVTDDTKQDWWYIVDQDTIGPRPELLREFALDTGRSAYLYSTDGFVKYASSQGTAISEDARTELTAVTAERIKASNARLSERLLEIQKNSERTRKSFNDIDRALRLNEQLAPVLEHIQSQIRDAVMADIMRRQAVTGARSLDPYVTSFPPLDEDASETLSDEDSDQEPIDDSDIDVDTEG